MKKIITLIIVIAIVVLGWYLLGENTTEAPVVDERQETPAMMEEPSSVEELVGTYVINAEASVVNWEGGSLAGSSHVGTIPIKNTSTVVISEEGLVESFEIIFDVNNLTSDSEGLTTHLKNADFFETDVYPEATYLIEDLATTAIIGSLTIKGVQDELFGSIITSIEETDSSLIISGNTTFDRTAFGITYNSGSFFKSLGERAIADDVDVEFSLVLDKQ